MSVSGMVVGLNASSKSLHTYVQVLGKDWLKSSAFSYVCWVPFFSFPYIKLLEYCY